jgi:methylenetetrahydrofolate reductase (NADPH)
MNAFGFRPDVKLTDVLARNRFTLSAEVIPPRNGTEQARVLTQVDQLIEAGAEFLAVTKGAGGSLRGGSLPIAQSIKEQFKVPCIAHFTCRDLTPPEVENQLMDHHYFGIRNILALRGDPPDGQPEWKARDGGYSYAYQLIQQIKRLNTGEYLERAGGPKAEGADRTDFCIGAAAYPEHPDEEERARFFRLKVEAGAEYGITQMVFDPDVYASFLELCEKHGVRVPILPGTRLLKTRPQALRMRDKFKSAVPESVLSQLSERDEPGALERAVEVFLKLVERFRAAGAPGVHLYVISDTTGAASALGRLSGKGAGS